MNLYALDIVPGHARPGEAARHIKILDEYFAGDLLSAINGTSCRAFAKTRPPSAGRHELETLRAAINYHQAEGLCSEIIRVKLPARSPGRERWLSRQEAASLIRAAWRFRERQKGIQTDRASRKHIARFILVALYTGSRAAIVCGAALQPTEGQGWIDLKRGVFYRRPAGRRETKKRAPPVPLPAQLLAHLRRWKAQGQRYAVEWNGEPIKSIGKGFRAAAKAAGLADVSPHILRHTAATWLMQAGADLWQAAGFLGMTVQTLSERYGHHHPEHLAGAVASYSKHRRDHAAKRAKKAGEAGPEAGPENVIPLHKADLSP